MSRKEAGRKRREFWWGGGRNELYITLIEESVLNIKWDFHFSYREVKEERFQALLFTSSYTKVQI